MTDETYVYFDNKTAMQANLSYEDVKDLIAKACSKGRDFIELEASNNEKCYVNVNKIDFISEYFLSMG